MRGEGPLLGIGDLPGGGILQQSGNSCGTCSLSVVLRHFGIETDPGELDREIRNANLFTAPCLIVREAGRRGLEAAFFNKSGVEELERFLNRGIPVILLVDTQPRNLFRPLHLHYVTAICYRKEPEFRLGIYNPWGMREEITGRELASIWRNVHLGPFVCWDGALIAVAPAGSGLGKGRPWGARGVNTLALAFAGAVNGAAHLLRDRRYREGTLEILGAPPRLLLGAVLFAFERITSAAARGAGALRLIRYTIKVDIADAMLTLFAPGVRRTTVSAADPSASRIVDLLTGTGSVLLAYAERFPWSGITAVDLDPGVLEVVRSRLEGSGYFILETLAADAREVPLPDSSADIVNLSFCLHELDADARRLVLAEARRLLQGGGQLLVTEYRELKGKLISALYRVFLRAFEPPWVDEIFQGGLEAEVESAGFVVEEVRELPFTRLVSARKPPSVGAPLSAGVR